MNMPDLTRLNADQMDISRSLCREIVDIDRCVHALRAPLELLAARETDRVDIERLFEIYAELQAGVNLLEKRLLLFEDAGSGGEPDPALSV